MPDGRQDWAGVVLQAEAGRAGAAGAASHSSHVSPTTRPVSTSHPASPPARALQARSPRRIASDLPARLTPLRHEQPGVALEAGAPATATARSAGTIWFDHTDLAHYFESNRTPTGIQRVEIELYRAARQRVSAPGDARIGACVFDPRRRLWVVMPSEAFGSLCGVSTDPGAAPDQHAAGDAQLDATGWSDAVVALQAAIAVAPPVPFRRHDVLITVGATWWIPDYLVLVRHLQHDRGVLYAPFVHDCIPVLVPETCAAELVAEFRDWFAAAMHAADLTFANSRCTAQDMISCAQAAQLPTPMPHVVRLDAHAGVRPASEARHDAPLIHARLGVRRRFALFVATIEARKDHIFVFRCWQELIARYGADTVPDLLCVGKSGWLVQFTMNWLQVNPVLADKVKLLGTVSDEDLAALYATAEFCVYNSHYEGWGLPVTESLCHGRVPLVPHHSSLPEAGGQFAAYFEPGSPESFITQATQLLDPGVRSGLERRIRARYRPRPWSAVLEQIVGTAARAPLRVRPRAAGVPLRAGGIYSFSRRTAAAGPARSRDGTPLLPGSLARFGTGWWLPEDWGCWSRAPQAHLLFSLAPERPSVSTLMSVPLSGLAEAPAAFQHAPGPASALPQYSIYILLRCGPAPQRIEVEAGGVCSGPITLQPHRRELIRLSFNETVGSSGDVLVGVRAEPYSLADHTDGRDPRRIGFGLEALAIIGACDFQARADMLELAVMPI